jgi:SWIM zinc finger
MAEVLDSYLHASSYTRGATRDDLVLETAAGLTPQGLVANPVFFRGNVTRPDVAAAGLRTLVEIASTRYFNPIPGGFASLDPIVTANGDRLRCEAFSACNGIYARLDLLGETFDEASLGFGTTNIDINPPLAQALAAIRAQDTLHLSVGPARIEVTTPEGRYEERKVKLPERWVRALAETQSIASTLELRQTLDAAAWRRFINNLPMSGGSGAGVTMWLLPSASGLRQTGKPHADAISLAGSARLSAVKRLQHLVQTVRIYGPKVDADSKGAISAWEFFLPGARLVLMLSPEPWRGFSGEGALLHALSRADTDDAHTINSLLAWEAAIDQAALVQETGLPAERVHHGLQVLATSGHVGFDLHEQSYFHRQLPFIESRLEENYPRLRAARELIEAKAVVPDGERLRVRSDDHYHWVSFADGVPRCTCYFWSKYKGSRGPCKHILAAQLYVDAAR